jgi:hypothetical protein
VRLTIGIDKNATHAWLGQPDQEGNSMAAVLVIVTDNTMTVSQVQTALTKASNCVGTMGAAGATVKQYEGHAGQTS